MDFLSPIMLAMFLNNGSEPNFKSESTEMIKKIEAKISEQAKIICEKDTLTTEEMFILPTFHSILVQVERKEISEKEKSQQLKEIKNKINEFNSDVGIKFD